MTENSNKTENPAVPRISYGHNMRMTFLSMIILVAGIVIGSAGTMIITKQTTPPRGGKGGDGPAVWLTRRMQETLDLTEEQTKIIEPINKKYMEKLRAIQESAKPKIDAAVKQMKKDISAVLTAEQNEKWERQMREFQKKFRMHRGPGDGRGRGGGRYGPGSRRGPGNGQGGGRGFAPDGDRSRMRRGQGPMGTGSDPNGERMWRHRPPEFRPPPPDPNEP